MRLSMAWIHEFVNWNRSFIFRFKAESFIIFFKYVKDIHVCQLNNILQINDEFATRPFAGSVSSFPFKYNV